MIEMLLRRHCQSGDYCENVMENPEPKEKIVKTSIVDVLKASGGLLTAITIAFVGYYTNNSLEKMKASETRAQLYAELMSKREESESALRKDMFVSIIGSFLNPSPDTLDKKVLNLELLAYNFHEALNLKPLFMHVAKQVNTTKDIGKPDYQQRLERVAHEVARKQVMVLGSAGAIFDRIVDLESLRANPYGMPLEEETLEVGGIKRIFRVYVLKEDPEMHEIQVRLTIATPDEKGREETEVTEFWVGSFDFPMIDNVRLLPDQRAAIVLNRYDQKSAYISVVYYPGGYASLKERPYFQEVVDKLISGKQ